MHAYLHVQTIVDPGMDGHDAGRQSGVDWESITIVQAQQRRTGGPRADIVRIKVGVVRTAHARWIGVQIEDRPVILVPPAGAAVVIGALREALGSM